MGSITATAQPEKGRTSHPSPRCQVFRIVAGGTPVLIREGAPCVLSHNKATIYDTEGPLDQLTTYRAIVQLNANAGMELTVEEWTPANGVTFGGAVTQSKDYYAAGNASLKFVSDASFAAPQIMSDAFAVTVGVSYTAVAQVLSATAWNGGLGLLISWYTSGLVFLSNSGAAGNLWPATGTWESYTVTGTAPATAAFARVFLLVAGSPSAGQTFYLDEAYATTPLGTVDSNAVVLPSSSGGWWKDPLHPATMIRVQDQETAYRSVVSCGSYQGVALVNVTRPNRPNDSTILEVPSQALGIGVFAHRKSSRRTVTVASGSITDADALRALHDQGGPLLLQLPAAYGVPEQYALCSTLQSSALGPDMRRQMEVHQTDVVHCQPPVGPNEGVLGARYRDLRKGGQQTTYAAATAASLTWQDGLKGNIS
jgi:hypothetical protein